MANKIDPSAPVYSQILRAPDHPSTSAYPADHGYQHQQLSYQPPVQQGYLQQGFNYQQPPPAGTVQYYPNGVHGSDPSTVVIVTQGQQQPAPVYYEQHSTTQQRFTWHYALSCFTFWLCGFIFGAFAFMMAVKARHKAAEGDVHGANRMGNASLATSLTGFLIGCALWGFLIWYLVVYVINDCTYYICFGCYRYRTNYYSPSNCYCDVNGFCYYN